MTGVFATKRIVLWDTLLAKLDEKEVLHVMGHEMGHYVLGHVVRSIVLSAVLTLGRALSGRLVRPAAGRRVMPLAWALTGFPTWPRCRSC